MFILLDHCIYFCITIDELKPTHTTDFILQMIYVAPLTESSPKNYRNQLQTTHIRSAHCFLLNFLITTPQIEHPDFVIRPVSTIKCSCIRQREMHNYTL